MNPQTVEVCSSCANLLRFSVDAQSIESLASNLALLQSSRLACKLCEKIFSLWPGDRAQRRFPEINATPEESIGTNVIRKDTQVSENGLSWALFVISFNIPRRAFMYNREFSITICKDECTSQKQCILDSLLTFDFSKRLEATDVEEGIVIAAGENQCFKTMASGVRVKSSSLQAIHQSLTVATTRSRHIEQHDIKIDIFSRA